MKNTLRVSSSACSKPRLGHERWQHCLRAGPNNSTLPATSALKLQLTDMLQGIDRGIFGLKSDQRQAIADVLQQLELRSEVPSPTLTPAVLSGKWRLLYTTVTITGVRRTKLGLREFVKLEDVCQTIDVDSQQAINEVFFSVAGLGTLRGSLKITATRQGLLTS